MTLEERIKMLEERLTERRNILAQVQRECFQLEGAVLALRELHDDGKPDSAGADVEAGEPVGHQSTNSDVAQ